MHVWPSTPPPVVLIKFAFKWKLIHSLIYIFWRQSANPVQFVMSSRSQPCNVTCFIPRPGLPDFSGCNKPKRGNLNLPNGHNMYQNGNKYTNWQLSIAMPSKYTKVVVFCLKIYTIWQPCPQRTSNHVAITESTVLSFDRIKSVAHNF
jgi:hypothetical protein